MGQKTERDMRDMSSSCGMWSAQMSHAQWACAGFGGHRHQHNWPCLQRSRPRWHAQVMPRKPPQHPARTHVYVSLPRRLQLLHQSVAQHLAGGKHVANSRVGVATAALEKEERLAVGSRHHGGLREGREGITAVTNTGLTTGQETETGAASSHGGPAAHVQASPLRPAPSTHRQSPPLTSRSMSDTAAYGSSTLLPWVCESWVHTHSEERSGTCGRRWVGATGRAGGGHSHARREVRRSPSGPAAAVGERVAAPAAAAAPHHVEHGGKLFAGHLLAEQALHHGRRVHHAKVAALCLVEPARGVAVRWGFRGLMGSQGKEGRNGTGPPAQPPICTSGAETDARSCPTPPAAQVRRPHRVELRSLASERFM